MTSNHNVVAPEESVGRQGVFFNVMRGKPGKPTE